MAEEKKRLYWLSLKKDFFKRHDVRIVKGMENGKDYIIFYLELLCESLDHQGKLRFSEAIPYNESMLATITDTNIDIVRSAIKLFVQLGLVEIWDDGTYFMTRVQEMSGSYIDNDNARRQREYYERQKRKALGECYDGVRKPNDKQETISKNNKVFVSNDTHTYRAHTPNNGEVEVNTSTAAYNGINAHDALPDFIERFNSISGLVKYRKPSINDELALDRILREFSEEEIEETFTKLAKSDFLRGGNPNAWKATFDWFIKFDNFKKVFNGNFDNRQTDKTSEEKPMTEEEIEAKRELDERMKEIERRSEERMRKWREEQDGNREDL